jgi:hypothetical protein
LLATALPDPRHRAARPSRATGLAARVMAHARTAGPLVECVE